MLVDLSQQSVVEGSPEIDREGGCGRGTHSASPIASEMVCVPVKLWYPGCGCKGLRRCWERGLGGWVLERCDDSCGGKFRREVIKRAGFHVHSGMLGIMKTARC